MRPRQRWRGLCRGSLPIVDDESCDFLCATKNDVSDAALDLEWSGLEEISICSRRYWQPSERKGALGAREMGGDKVANLPSIVTDYVVESVLGKGSR